MDVGKITAAHKDPERAKVGATAFMAALARAFASTGRNPLVRDPVATAMFRWDALSKGTPFHMIFMFSLWQWRPLTSILFWLVTKLTGRDMFKATDMMGTRSKFIDDALASAVKEKGVQQVVIMGAGLDARACRLSVLREGSQKVRVFEIDFAAFMEAKQIFFDQLGFGDTYKNRGHDLSGGVFVGTDLSQSPETWKKDLLGKGFNPKVKTFWIIEGVTGYLELDELKVLFGAMTSLSSAGSQIAATWNGSSQNSGNSPWKQDIHKSVVDDPAVIMTPLKWKILEHYPIGAAVRRYGLSNSSIAADDRSYWLSLHTKE